MEGQPGLVSANQRAKKVRIACQRCRDRRIKCDGQVPACSKCAKAGVPCIDVHSRSGERRIPRTDQVGPNDRIQWLERLVKERLPDVDLSAGPALDSADEATQVDVEDSQIDNSGSTSLGKRASESNDNEASIRKRARRMALDLGLLSLDINASQVQYLGSSSGSFFASLLQTGSNSIRKEPSEATSREIDTHTANSIGNGQLHETNDAGDDLLKTLKDALPPRAQCNALVDQYFSYYHAEYPVLHRPSFEHLVDSLYRYAAGQSSRTTRYNGWPTAITTFSYNGETARLGGKDIITIPARAAAAQLFLTLSIAAHVNLRRRSFSVDPSKFHGLALKLSQQVLSDVSLPSLQVIVLLVLQSFWTHQRGNVWITLHSAMACAIDLGLHREVKESSRFSPVALQMRRSIFFCVYTLDRLISTAQGRPLGFQDDTMDLSLPAPLPSASDTDVTQQDQTCLPYSIARFEWATIISKIKFDFYRLKDALAPSTLAALHTETTLRLDRWLSTATEATEKCNLAERNRLQTFLAIDYHFAVCLLYQPSHACISPDAIALQRCFESAVQRIRLYGTLSDHNQLYMTWPNTHGIFLAGTTLVYCIWISPEVRSRCTVSDLAKDFRTCSNLLTLAGEWWPIAQRGRRSFDRLADLTMDSLLSGTGSTYAQASTSTACRAIDEQPVMNSDIFASLNFQSPSKNIEEILQSLLQSDVPLADSLDMFDASILGQDGNSWQQNGFFSFDLEDPV